jgi:hypothetical protein
MPIKLPYWAHIEGLRTGILYIYTKVRILCLPHTYTKDNNFWNSVSSHAISWGGRKRYTLEENEKEKKRKTKNILSFFTREHHDEHQHIKAQHLVTKRDSVL